MTKIHEELVRGQIKIVAEMVGEGRGEYTVVINIGLMTEFKSPVATDSAAVVADVAKMSSTSGVTKRKAINIVARKHGIAPNQVYEILEVFKKSV